MNGDSLIGFSGLSIVKIHHTRVDSERSDNPPKPGQHPKDFCDMRCNRRSKAIMVDCLSANPPYVTHRTAVTYVYLYR